MILENKDKTEDPQSDIPSPSTLEGEELSNNPDEVPDCLVCGACCFSSLERYVHVTGDDHERMDDLADEFTNFIENRCYMNIIDDHCAALRIDVETSQFLCEIYEYRPSICRNLERGSPECLFEHDKKADRVAVALRK